MEAGSNMSVAACGELPRYRCHKEVWALKIKEIRAAQYPNFERATCRGCAALGTACGNCERCKWIAENGNPGYVIVPEDERYARFCVDREYFNKHQPKAGGYYVVYADGYKSFSPAEAFESGYTRIIEAQ
jgi:hypothetical protein